MESDVRSMSTFPDFLLNDDDDDDCIGTDGATSEQMVHVSSQGTLVMVYKGQRFF